MTTMQNRAGQAIIRPVKARDRAGLLAVEAGATPKLRYLDRVFDLFLSDPTGEFMIAEIDGRAVGCAKFTVMPDRSAWLETLRVAPDFQGRGLGKLMYQRFFELARRDGLAAMRMYTGISNLVSKGLAERFGFGRVGTYRGVWRLAPEETVPAADFRPVTDPDRAAELTLSLAERWAGFIVLNRTFYAVAPELGPRLAEAGWLHEDGSGNTVVLGARFMPEQALHLAAFDGDPAACLGFALNQAAQRGGVRLSCYIPPADRELELVFLDKGFEKEPSDLIVMETGV